MVNEPGGTSGAHGGTEAAEQAERYGSPDEVAVSGVAPRSPRSRLTDIAEQTVIRTGNAAATGTVPGPPDRGESANPSGDGEKPAQPHVEAVSELDAAQVRARRHRFHARLGEFRRSQVLVPLGALPGPDRAAEAPLTVDMGGVRWILAFTGEAALARYAVARGEGEREWRYRGVWGAALLDAAVPTVAESGVPCGVLVDAADGDRGLVLPPVMGVVPEDVAVDGPEAFGWRSGDAAGPGGEKGR